MTKKQREEWGNFVRVFTQDFPDAPSWVPEALHEAAQKLSRIDEADANEGSTPRREKREANILAEMGKILKPHNIKLKRGGDPRGYALRVLLPSGRYNTWGGAEDGWGIPE